MKIARSFMGKDERVINTIIGHLADFLLTCCTPVANPHRATPPSNRIIFLTSNFNLNSNFKLNEPNLTLSSYYFSLVCRFEMTAVEEGVRVCVLSYLL